MQVCFILFFIGFSFRIDNLIWVVLFDSRMWSDGLKLKVYVLFVDFVLMYFMMYYAVRMEGSLIV